MANTRRDVYSQTLSNPNITPQSPSGSNSNVVQPAYDPSLLFGGPTNMYNVLGNDPSWLANSQNSQFINNYVPTLAPYVQPAQQYMQQQQQQYVQPMPQYPSNYVGNAHLAPSYQGANTTGGTSAQDAMRLLQGYNSDGSRMAGYTGSYAQAPSYGGMSPDQSLASLFGGMDYLSGFAQNAGYPTSLNPNLRQGAQNMSIDQLPAWNAMVQAQQRSIDRNFADLQEAFNVGGGRFSSSFGQGAADFYNQATRDQNSLLAQMQTGALESGMNRFVGTEEAARQRELQASSQLGQFAYGGASQLASQDFQSQMQQNQQALQAAMQMGASSDQAAQLIAQFGAQGALAMLGTSSQAAQGLYSNENAAAMAMYQAQLQAMNQQNQYDLALRQMGLGAAGQYGNLWNNNLLTGGQLGGQQYGITAQQQQAAYQEWLRTQPYNNPLLSYIYAGATGYPPVYMPQQQTPWWAYLAGPAASAAGSAIAAWG